MGTPATPKGESNKATSRSETKKNCFVVAVLLLGGVLCISSLHRSFHDTYSLYSVCSGKRSSIHFHVSTNDDYRQAYVESGGFFGDIPSTEWRSLKHRILSTVDHADDHRGFSYSQRVKPFLDGIANQQENDEQHQKRQLPRELRDPAYFYQHSFEPNFACRHERRVGGMGDGPKWVCDPHRISRSDVSKKEEAVGGHRCLVYSIGSAGNTLFERGVQRDVPGGCEVHTFDMMTWNRRNGNFSALLTETNAIFHPWGIETAENVRRNPQKFKTFQETLEVLNHTGRIIDVFKIDCEGCEWRIYEDWFDANVTLRQILVEVHGVKVPQTFELFDRLMRRENYVCFHKEANVISKPPADAWEFAFLKLAPAAFVDESDGDDPD